MNCCFDSAIRNILVIFIASVFMTITEAVSEIDDLSSNYIKRRSYTTNTNNNKGKNTVVPYKKSIDPLYSFMTTGSSLSSEIRNQWNDPFKSLTYKLKVATFNIWGLITSKNRQERVLAITRYFTKNPRGLDIICLQELWMADDYRSIRASLSLEFPHAHYFKSGVVGSGLAVFSKYPIVEAWWKGFTLTGKAHRLFDGDWYAGKGVGAVRIKHPTIGLVDVFNTHVIKLDLKFKN